MPIFTSKAPKVPYDKAADARTTAEAALSSFTGVLVDLKYAVSLLTEVEAEESAAAEAATARAQAAAKDRQYNEIVAGRIEHLLGEQSS